MATSAGVVSAQDPPADEQLPFDLSRAALAELVARQTQPLRDRLPLELRFLAEVCELNDEQVSKLERQGNRIIDRLREDLELAILRHEPGKPTRNYVVVQNQAVAVTAGFDREALTAPGAALRRELTKAVQHAWPAAGNKCDAEERRLIAFRKRTGALAKACEIDAILLLRGPQRTELCDQLMRRTSDDWWQTANARAPVNDPDERLLASVARGSLCVFLLSAVEWQTVLRPAQLARYRELWGPRKEEMVFLLPAAPKPVAQVQAFPQRAGLRPAARLVRRGPKLSDQVRCLTAHLEEAIDEVDSTCQLAPTQREKLLLAGKLDIQAFESRHGLLPEEVPDGEQTIVSEVSVPSGKPVLPLSVLTDEVSYFQRALNGRLSEGQRRQLAAAAGERRAFQRQAVVAAVVAGFEHASALTSQQCESLSEALNESLALDDFGASANWPLAYLRRLAQLPEERLRSWLTELQWPYARDQLLQLTEIVRQYEVQRQGQTVPGASGSEALRN